MTLPIGRCDPNAEAWTNAAFSWARRDNPAEMLANIDRLDRAQVLAAWHAANRLVGALAERHAVLSSLSTPDGAS